MKTAHEVTHGKFIIHFLNDDDIQQINHWVHGLQWPQSVDHRIVHENWHQNTARLNRLNKLVLKTTHNTNRELLRGQHEVATLISTTTGVCRVDRPETKVAHYFAFAPEGIYCILLPCAWYGVSKDNRNPSKLLILCQELGRLLLAATKKYLWICKSIPFCNTCYLLITSTCRTHL